jgi:quinol monooxygenase YgiN
MDIGRREFIVTVGAVVATLGVAPFGTPAWAVSQGARGAQKMYGMIGKMIATPGQRDALIALLLEGIGAMPGCLSYIVATDATDANAIWITEAWENKESHDASLKLPAVQQTIAKARPIIAGFGESFITAPVGGYGLKSASNP